MYRSSFEVVRTFIGLTVVFCFATGELHVALSNLPYESEYPYLLNSPRKGIASGSWWWPQKRQKPLVASHASSSFKATSSGERSAQPHQFLGSRCRGESSEAAHSGFSVMRSTQSTVFFCHSVTAFSKPGGFFLMQPSFNSRPHFRETISAMSSLKFRVESLEIRRSQFGFLQTYYCTAADSRLDLDISCVLVVDGFELLFLEIWFVLGVV